MRQREIPLRAVINMTKVHTKGVGSSVTTVDPPFSKRLVCSQKVIVTERVFPGGIPTRRRSVPTSTGDVSYGFWLSGIVISFTGTVILSFSPPFVESQTSARSETRFSGHIKKE